MKFAILFFIVASLSACGYVDRGAAAITGNGTETCVDGVKYLQFISGVTVKYLPDGKIATCK